MKRKFVNSSNVLKIAKHLLEFEIHHLQEKYHLDATAFVEELQHALRQYIHPPENQAEIKHWHSIEYIDNSLKHLIQSVSGFISLLTAEAQKKIEQQFNPLYEGEKIV